MQIGIQIYNEKPMVAVTITDSDGNFLASQFMSADLADFYAKQLIATAAEIRRINESDSTVSY